MKQDGDRDGAAIELSPITSIFLHLMQVQITTTKKFLFNIF